MSTGNFFLVHRRQEGRGFMGHVTTGEPHRISWNQVDYSGPIILPDTSN